MRKTNFKKKAKTTKKQATNSSVTDSFLKTLIKSSGNELGTLMSEETLSNTTEWLDTGSYALNGLINANIFKGIANNKIVGFAGAESTGKTFLVLSIAKLAIENGYAIAYFDSENSTEKEMLVKRDMDPSKFMYFPVDTVENFRKQTIGIVNKYNETDSTKRPKLLIILDSLGNLSTRKEMADSEEGSEKKDMTRPGIIKSVFRTLSLKLAQAKVPMLITNHTYDVIGCLTGDTQVIQTKVYDKGIEVEPYDEYVNISDIKIGDYVKTLVGTRKVTETYEYDVDEIYELELENGEVIKATPNHKFLTENLEWKTIEELKENDSIISCIG